MTMHRDYSLSGPASAAPVLDGAPVAGRLRVRWWAPKITTERLVELRRPSDQPALNNFLLWLALLLVSGLIAYFSWGTLWAVPAFFAYGTIYSSSDARWHECSHGTAFQNQTLNRWFYELSSFMTLREAYLWRYSHTRHHTHTVVVGQDPEIQVARPADLLKILMDFAFLRSGPVEMARILRHAFRGLGPDEVVYVPPKARARLIRSSRIYVALWAVLLLWCLALGSILPAMFVILPRFYGGWLHQLLALTQHAGLVENTSDHRLNSRTVYLNRVFGFLYMNMNYHIEHHVSPTVPYHALPAYHDAIKAQCPAPYTGVWDVYREMIPVLWRQAFGAPDEHILRTLPTATLV